jgi:hypothetical protein
MAVGTNRLVSMSDGNEKIRRWRLRIEECRIEAESLGPEGRHTMQSVIESYERLIVLIGGLNKPKG